MKATCREVHALVSQSLDRPLSLRERTTMQLHLLICKACTRFNVQMDVLRQAFRQGPPPGDAS